MTGIRNGKTWNSVLSRIHEKIKNAVQRGRFPKKRSLKTPWRNKFLTHSAPAYGVTIVQKCIGQTKTPYDKQW